MAITDQIEVSELFYSIQGESSNAGYPCVFIRLTGCNLRCSYCDVKYSYEEKGKLYDISSLLHYVDKYPNVLVEVTGGEPLQQKLCISLLEGLIKRKRKTLLETNGTLSLRSIPDGVTIIADIKCPGSSFGDSFLPENLAEIKRRGSLLFGSCEIKFVLTGKEDYRWAKEKVIEHNLMEFAPVHFSPVTQLFSPKVLADLLLRDHLPVKLQLQLHTLIWPDTPRGV